MKKILSLSLLACLPLCGCPPVVVETNAPPPPAAEVEVDAAPAAEVEYYYVGGEYYYWHPGYNHWEHYHGIPDRRYAIHRMDRLPDRPAHREVRRTEHRERRDEHREADHEEHR